MAFSKSFLPVVVAVAVCFIGIVRAGHEGNETLSLEDVKSYLEEKKVGLESYWCDCVKKGKEAEIADDRVIAESCLGMFRLMVNSTVMARYVKCSDDYSLWKLDFTSGPIISPEESSISPKAVPNGNSLAAADGTTTSETTSTTNGTTTPSTTTTTSDTTSSTNGTTTPSTTTTTSDTTSTTSGTPPISSGTFTATKQTTPADETSTSADGTSPINKPTAEPSFDAGNLAWIIPLIIVVLVGMGAAGYFLHSYSKKKGYTRSAKSNGEPVKTNVEGV